MKRIVVNFINFQNISINCEECPHDFFISLILMILADLLTEKNKENIVIDSIIYEKKIRWKCNTCMKMMKSFLVTYVTINIGLAIAH